MNIEQWSFAANKKQFSECRSKNNNNHVSKRREKKCKEIKNRQKITSVVKIKKKYDNAIKTNLCKKEK